MKTKIVGSLLPLASVLAILPGLALANGVAEHGWVEDSAVLSVEKGKALSARSIASRGTVTSGITMYGGFDPAASGPIYILVRGNSMGSLGITQNYLDRPTVTLYNAAGQVLISSTASCGGGPVATYYQNIRHTPTSENDACIYNQNSAPGPVTFTVTPSSGSVRTGEVLFEVTLGP